MYEYIHKNKDEGLRVIPQALVLVLSMELLFRGPSVP